MASDAGIILRRGWNIVDITTARHYYDKNILRGGPENIGREWKSDQVRQTAAAEKPIEAKMLEEEAAVVCRECLGTGIVSGWSEIAYFEDRRPCARCEAGFRVDSKIADMVKRAQLEERLSRR